MSQKYITDESQTQIYYCSVFLKGSVSTLFMKVIPITPKNKMRDRFH